MRKPGQIIELPDGRKAIRYNEQILLQNHKKVVLHLLDNDLKLIKKPDGREATLIQSLPDYQETISKSKLIGYVD